MEIHHTDRIPAPPGTARPGVPVKDGSAGRRAFLAGRTARIPSYSSMLRNCPADGCPRRPSRIVAVTAREWPRINGDSPVHLAVCRPEHLITASCPVGCPAPLLPARVLGRLARVAGRHAEAVACWGPSVTVGDVVRVYRQSRLSEIAGLGAQHFRYRGRPGLRRDSPRRQPPATTVPHARRTTTPASAAPSPAPDVPPRRTAGEGDPAMALAEPGWMPGQAA
jgi:hypothetical protein